MRYSRQLIVLSLQPAVFEVLWIYLTFMVI